MRMFMERFSGNGICELISEGLCPLRKSTGEETSQGHSQGHYGLRAGTLCRARRSRDGKTTESTAFLSRRTPIPGAGGAFILFPIWNTSPYLGLRPHLPLPHSSPTASSKILSLPSGTSIPPALLTSLFASLILYRSQGQPGHRLGST